MKPAEPTFVRLALWEELVGEYEGFSIDQHFLYAIIDGRTLALPNDSNEAELVKRGLENVAKGSRISVLHTDLPRKTFLIRLDDNKQSRDPPP